MMTTVAVLGDSSSVGFGTGGRSYAIQLSEKLGAELVAVIAGLGKTTAVALETDLSTIAGLHADVVVVQTGMADSLLHPGQRLQRWIEHFVPETWHGVDGLERRAVFEPNRWHRARQQVAAAAKTALKRTLITVSRGYTRMLPAEYSQCLDRLLTGIEAAGGVVVSIGIYRIDQRYFPRQDNAIAPFVAARRAVLARHPNVVSVEPDEVLVRWGDFLDDHAHWSAAGHERVADHIVRRLKEARPDLDLGWSSHGSAPGLLSPSWSLADLATEDAP